MVLDTVSLRSMIRRPIGMECSDSSAVCGTLRRREPLRSSCASLGGIIYTGRHVATDIRVHRCVWVCVCDDGPSTSARLVASSPSSINQPARQNRGHGVSGRISCQAIRRLLSRGNNPPRRPEGRIYKDSRHGDVRGDAAQGQGQRARPAILPRRLGAVHQRAPRHGRLRGRRLPGGGS